MENKLITIDDFKREANAKLPQDTWDFIENGAFEEYTQKHNVDAYKNILLRPKVLNDVSHLNTEITLLNNKHTKPFLIAPMGAMAAIHPLSETGMLEGANQFHCSVIASTMATKSLEQMMSKAKQAMWFQLYIFKDRNKTANLIKNAEKAGYQALVITVDTPVLGRRLSMLRHQEKLPLETEPPAFRARNLTNIGFNTAPSGTTIPFSDFYQISKIIDASFNWEDITWIRSVTKLPIFLKGILHPQDAELAMQYQVNGIIASNHGGRQLDTEIATIEALPDIVSVVNDKIPVLVDGGIRSGLDVFKSIALGADAVLIGRPIIWGLAVGGPEGVSQVLNILLDEFRETMMLCGCQDIQTIKKLGSSLLRQQ